MFHLESVSLYHHHHVIFDRVHCHFAAGKLYYLLGPHGSGKTTLFRLLTHQEMPQSGKILYQQQPLHRLRGRALTQYRRSLVLIPQSPKLLPGHTVETNVGLGLRLQNHSQGECASRIQKLAKNLGLSHLLQKTVAQLSAGEQQLVAIARALAVRPKALIADDPLQHLDLEFSQVVLDAFREFAQQGSLVLVGSSFIPAPLASSWQVLKIQHQVIQKINAVHPA